MNVNNTLKCYGLHAKLVKLSELLTVSSATDLGHE
jgi:hypothetical protein